MNQWKLHWFTMKLTVEEGVWRIIMLKNEYPANLGNATIITNGTARGNGFVMLRWEDIFDYYSEEPVSITVKEKENSIEEDYTRIIRIRTWNQRKKSFSWSIYSRDREILDSLVIRRVVWDMGGDEEWLKKHIRENRATALEQWPSIEICNKYMFPDKASHISRLIHSLDSKIENGFTLHKNHNPTWEWRDIEILRLYDWGQIHLTWCPDRKNEEIEAQIKELVLGMDYTMEKTDENIFEMNFIYGMSPEEYKNFFFE